MKDGSNSMTEMQFLMKFIKHLEHDGYIEYKKTYITDYAHRFLELHHSNYYEVEFIRKQEESEDEYNTYALPS